MSDLNILDELIKKQPPLKYMYQCAVCGMIMQAYTKLKKIKCLRCFTELVIVKDKRGWISR